MIPLSDDNPTRRIPVVTVVLLLIIGAVWVLVQGAGLNFLVLVTSVCNLGLVAGEITRSAPLGTSVEIAEGLTCAVDAEQINYFTPLTSMFLHGSWAHIIGNSLFLWVFGNNVEDSMGRFRFFIFYLVCGLVAAGAQVAMDPASPMPMVGASGAISGVMGAYLILYPHARVNMLFILFFIIRVIPIPAWLVLIYWFSIQLVSALPQLAGVQTEVSSGVAFMAHIGGFVAGVVLVKLFENKRLHKIRVWD